MTETRVASSPTTGAARDSVRTLIGFGLFWLITRFTTPETAESLSGIVEGLIVIVTSAALALFGKLSRNKGAEEGEPPVVGLVV